MDARSMSTRRGSVARSGEADSSKAETNSFEETGPVVGLFFFLPVLINDMSGKAIPAGLQELVRVTGEVELTAAEVSDCEGNMMTAKLEVVALPVASKVRLEVYNIAGQRVATVVDEYLSAGYHQAVFHGVDDSGRQLASGVYLHRLVAGDYVETRKMLLIK